MTSHELSSMLWIIGRLCLLTLLLSIACAVEVQVDEFEHDYAFAEVRSGDEAHEIFCNCKPEHFAYAGAATLMEMCPNINAQCRKSFCKPLCLRMAWTPTIDVKCEHAPGWSWCDKFAAQVHVAARALTSHFQAHTCLSLHFCNATDRMLNWVENHSFGNQYPKYHLPIESCVHEHATPQQKQLLCAACDKVVKVDIKRGECLPQFTVLQPGSLQERCLYMADVIGQRKDELLREFKSHVCRCLGCCGDGRCIFKNPDEGWMTSLIETVTTKISKKLEDEGWATGRRYAKKRQPT